MLKADYKGKQQERERETPTHKTQGYLATLSPALSVSYVRELEMVYKTVMLNNFM